MVAQTSTRVSTSFQRMNTITTAPAVVGERVRDSRSRSNRSPRATPNAAVVVESQAPQENPTRDTDQTGTARGYGSTL